MNDYINAQIINMKIIVKTFRQSCQLGAQKDDGTISKEEAKAIQRINAATKKFVAQLDKIK